MSRVVQDSRTSAMEQNDPDFAHLGPKGMLAPEDSRCTTSHLAVDLRTLAGSTIDDTVCVLT